MTDTFLTPLSIPQSKPTALPLQSPNLDDAIRQGEQILDMFKAMRDATTTEALQQQAVMVYRAFSHHQDRNLPQWLNPTTLPIRHMYNRSKKARAGHEVYTLAALDALLNLMRHLDGQPGYAPGENERLIRKAFWAPGTLFEEKHGSVENDYYELRIYKNGNALVVFKRRDLRDAMERIVQPIRRAALGLTP